MGSGLSRSRVQQVLTSHGCWLGNIQIPLLPFRKYEDDDVIKSSPFVQVRLIKKSQKENPNSQNTVILYLESKYKESAKIVVFKQEKQNDFLVTVPTVLYIEPSSTPADQVKGDKNDSEALVPEKTEGEKMRLEEQERIIKATSCQFDFDTSDVAVGDFISYVVYIVNNQPIEGDFTLFAKTSCFSHDVILLAPKQFTCEFFSKEDLPFLTECNGVWSGFTEYGGSPTDDFNNDWLLYNPSFILTTKNATRCMITLTLDENYSKDSDVDFPVGIIVLHRYKNTDENLQNIEKRIIAHSVFPLAKNQKVGKLKFITVIVI